MRRRYQAVALACALGASLASLPEAEAHRRVVVHPRHRYGYRTRVHAHGAVQVSPSGWYGGAGLFGTGILDQEGGAEALGSGGGLSLWGGIALTEVLGFELGWFGTFHNPATVFTEFGPETDYLVLQGVMLDAKIHVDRSDTMDTYLQGGVGAYFLGSEHAHSFDSVGTGFQVGAGIDLWLSDHWTLGLRARIHGIEMGPPNAMETDLFLSVATVESSLAVHF
jgi:opacity protein-like surface antigen